MRTGELLYPRRYPPALLVALCVSLPLGALAFGQSPVALWSALHDRSVFAGLAWALAAATAAIALALAGSIPLGYRRTQTAPGTRRRPRQIVALARVLPQPVVGAALLLALLHHGLSRDLLLNPGARLIGLLVLAMFAVSAPMLVLTVEDAFAGPARQFVIAARSLGADPRDAFWHAALPGARRVLQQAALMAWARAAGELGVVLFVAASLFPGLAGGRRARMFAGVGPAATLALLLLAAALGVLGVLGVLGLAQQDLRSPSGSRQRSALRLKTSRRPPSSLR